MYRLYLGDCTKVMQEMVSRGELIDLTVTSPPYDNLRNYEGTLRWDEEKWKEVLRLLYEVTVDGGVVVWVCGDATIKGSETGTSFKQALYAKEVGFNLHDTMIWHKPNPTPRDPKCYRYYQAFEYMFVFSKGKPRVCNYLREPCKKPGAVVKIPPCRYEDGSKPKKKIINVADTKIKSNVWQFANGSGPKIRYSHPATFPLALAEAHIKTWSNEGDLVFDPFMGSGTTGLAAANLGRNFVGVDVVEDYFYLAMGVVEGQS